MSIRSMTAYASAEAAIAAGTLACELRAVNHRFLEISVRLPDELRALEPALRERIAARVSRGKLDLGFRLRPAAQGDALALDDAMLEKLSALSHQLSARFGEMRVDMGTLLAFPGLLQGAQVDVEVLHADALALLDRVIDGFVAAREREGAALARVMIEKLDGVAKIASEVRTLVPDIRAGQRAKLQARLGDLAQGMEPARIEQELVLWLQKLDVEEELDRLESHVAEARRVLKQKEPVGRRLDFLLQEFNREANTLGSKSVDARTSNAAVELKVLIDQIREQVQNLE